MIQIQIANINQSVQPSNPIFQNKTNKKIIYSEHFLCAKNIRTLSQWLPINFDNSIPALGCIFGATTKNQ